MVKLECFYKRLALNTEARQDSWHRRSVRTHNWKLKYQQCGGYSMRDWLDLLCALQTHKNVKG